MKKLTVAFIMILAAVTFTGCSMDKGTKEYNKGIAAMKAGNYDQACELLGTAISKNTEEPLYYINYATTLVQLKRYGEAVSSYQKAITSGEKADEENNKRAYRGLGIAFYYQKKYDSAAEYLQKALDISALPELNMDAYLYLGAVWEVKDNMKAAYTTYGSALALDNKKICAYVGRYKAEIALSKFDDAEDTLRKGLNQTPSTTEDNYMYARLQFYKGDYDEAFTTLDKVKDTYPESYLYLGEIYSKNKKYKDAIDSFETYMAKGGNDENVTVYKQMADCYMKQDNYKKALTWLEKGIVLKNVSTTEIQDMCYNQIISYQKLKDTEKAYKLVKKYAAEYTNDDRFSNLVKEMEKDPAIAALAVD